MLWRQNVVWFETDLTKDEINGVVGGDLSSGDLSMDSGSGLVIPGSGLVYMGSGDDLLDSGLGGKFSGDISAYIPNCAGPPPQIQYDDQGNAYIAGAWIPNSWITGDATSTGWSQMPKTYLSSSDVFLMENNLDNGGDCLQSGDIG